MAIISPNSSMLVEVKDNIAHVAFNRPGALNALDEDLAYALGYIMGAISQDLSIRCVILFGCGNHFMAGGDVKTFHEELESEPDRISRRQHFEKLIGTFHVGLTKMRAIPQPIIGKIRGAVAGAGVAFAAGVAGAGVRGLLVGNLFGDDDFFGRGVVGVGRRGPDEQAAECQAESRDHGNGAGGSVAHASEH